MSRRAALNLLLLGAVAALAALVFLQPGIETPPPVPTLTDRAPESVARLRIERPGQTAVVLEKREGGWLMLEPLSLPESTTGPSAPENAGSAGEGENPAP